MNEGVENRKKGYTFKFFKTPHTLMLSLAAGKAPTRDELLWLVPFKNLSLLLLANKNQIAITPWYQ